ncbi:hypothetical protein AAHA92_00844 [Salvia divinorum]|uniref:Uncharacterized protein n=1 Tax=Salvia divinorum TaxID=28513 RepID=A0ABD1IM01_SALDI
MDKVLGVSFIEQMNQGNKLDGKFAWKSTSWTAAINALMANLNIKVDKNNILSSFEDLGEALRDLASTADILQFWHSNHMGLHNG